MHHHNLPVTPGAIIGYRKSGAPIRLAAGGSESDEGGTTEGGTADSGADAGQTDSTGGQDATGTAGSGQDGGTASSGDDDKTTRTVAAIRQEFKDERTKRQAAEKRLGEIQTALDADKADRAKRDKALAVALGLAPEDGPPDPVKLAEELERTRAQHQAELSQRDASARQQAVELAVLRTAGGHGGNGDALLDSRSFMATVNGLDPAAEDFAGQLGDAIKAAVEASPQYRTAAPAVAGSGQKPAPTPARSGGEHTSPGGNRQWTMDDVRASKGDPKAVAKAVEDGLLVDLGYHPSKKGR